MREKEKEKKKKNEKMKKKKRLLDPQLKQSMEENQKDQ